MIEDCTIHPTAEIKHPDLCNIYGCTIGEYSAVGPFVEIQRGVTIGRLCKVESHSFICEHVTIGNDVFIGHGVMFTNDKYPVIKSPVVFEKTIIDDGVSIGSGAVIGPGVHIGQHALIGAGAVVLKDIPAYTTAAGNPARIIRTFADLTERNNVLEKRYHSFSNTGRRAIPATIKAAIKLA